MVTPDYCRGILEAEALFRVFVIAFAAALVTTLGLTIGSGELCYRKHLARFFAGGHIDEKVLEKYFRIADTPEYVRNNGKANDSETGDDLFKKTEWSQFDWKASAQWTCSSDMLVNDLDLKF